MIIIGVGYGLSITFPIAITLGWVAAFFAVMTAYIRVLGGSCGLEQRFTGPMAKQHRMALLTGIAIISAFIPAEWGAWLCLVSPVDHYLRLCTYYHFENSPNFTRFNTRS